MDRVKIIGIEVDCLDKEMLLDQAVAWAEGTELRVVTYVNANCLNVAASDPEYRKVLSEGDLVYSDGIGAVWAGRLLQNHRLEKITGRDWIENFCQRAVTHHLSIYILAGKPGIARQSVDRLKQRWPGLKVVAARDGYFHEKSELEIIQEIALLRPDVLLIGMGVPNQEKWVARYRGSLKVRVCWTVGALFDFVAGIEPVVPNWMNRLGLEWLWRLWCDPYGKWRRYLLGNPLFVLRVFAQKLNIIRGR